MKKTRVYQIAEEVGMSNKDILAKLKELGIEAQNEKAELEEEGSCCEGNDIGGWGIEGACRVGGRKSSSELSEWSELLEL